MIPLLLCVQVVSAQPTSLPDQFGSGSNAFAIDFVVVGDVGNAPHSSGVGSVGYDYRIGKYEISENLITKAEAQGMASISRELGGTGDQPLGVSWADAAKFVNFLNTSKGYAAAYSVVEGQLPTRNPNAYYFIPSDNEWVKAAHYKAGGINAGYWRYATGSDTAPQPTNSSVLPNTAVYNAQTNQYENPRWASTSIYAAGGLSPYGTMGQNGNFSEFTDTLYAVSQVRSRGGNFNSTSSGLHHTNVDIAYFGYGSFWALGQRLYNIGFRVASVHDTSKPVLTLNGSDMIVFRGVPFVDPSVTFADNYDPPRPITTDGVVDTMTVGTYTLTYSAKDNAGNEARPVTRTVEVVLDPNGDEDNDGLNNTEEANLGTNPYLRDTDGDGVNDLREAGDGTDPLDPASFDSLNLGLVAYYPFNGDVRDQSGNSNHGSPQDLTPLANDSPAGGSAYRFNGTSSHVSVPHNESLALQDFTFSVWIKPARVMGEHQSILLKHTADMNGVGSWIFMLQSGTLVFQATPLFGGSEDMNAAGAVSPNEWRHYVLSYNSQSKVWTYYLNGAPDGSGVNLTPRQLNGSTAPLLIGAEWMWGGGKRYFYQGDMDAVRLYNRSLSSAEVALLHANDLYSGFGLEGAATKSPFDPATASNWSAGGTAWTVDTSVTHDGVDSVKAQTTDGQSTYREYTVTGPAVVDFWWKVSSEKNYDKFSYSLNGVNQETISGEVDWAYRTLTLPEGTHTIRWTYTKDDSGAVGQDAGWLDDFVVYPATATLQVSDGSTALDGEATVDFGSADTGSTGFTRSLTFANEGYVPLGVQLSLPDGSPFAFDDGAATYELLLGRGESVDVPIVLSTAGAGTKTAQLTISAPDSTVVPPPITLTGYVRGPDIGLAQDTTALTSGQTFDMGLAPRTVEFTIRNNGNVGDLVIVGISATGNFQITQQPATTIPPQTSTTFKVLAQSVASGVQAGSISITSNAANLAEFSLPLSSKSLIALPDGVTDGSMATSGTGGATGWDFGTTVLPSGQSGSALKTGATPNSGGSVLEFTTQTAGVVSWTWKVSTQENFDWLLCEVDGQEAAGISTKNGVWQTQVVQVPAGANVRWVYRKDASGNIGEDAGYLADVEFRSLAANQSFGQWAQTHGVTDPQQRMPKSGLQAMFGWLGGFRADGEITDGPSKVIIVGERLTYRYPVSKTADGTQQILFSPDMSSWTTRRISQRVVSEDADRMVIEATAPSGTKGFFKVVGVGDTSMVWVEGGTLPQASELAGTTVETFQIGRTEVTWSEWQEVRDWAVANGYTDLAGIGSGSGPDHPVHSVNWYDVVKWSNAKSEKEGLAPVYQVHGTVYRTGEVEPAVTSGANGYRLPTEAEWEWAARGGASSQGYIYSGSDDVNVVAWYSGNSSDGTKVVGTKAANELGIHDMSGNLWEWCSDGHPVLGRSIRGGAYYLGAADLVIDFDIRPYVHPATADIGFRLARQAILENRGDRRGVGRHSVSEGPGGVTFGHGHASSNSSKTKLRDRPDRQTQVGLTSRYPSPNSTAAPHPTAQHSRSTTSLTSNTGHSLRLTCCRFLAIHRAPAKDQRLTFRRLHSSHPAPAMRTKA